MFDYPTSPPFGTTVTMPDRTYRIWDGQKWRASPSAGDGILGGYLPISGGIMQGPLILVGDPRAPNEAASKHYVDTSAGGGGGGGHISVMSFGAVADGTTHPLSTRYATLAEAQLVYPFATSLTQELDWAAMQAALNYLTTFPEVPNEIGTGTASGGEIWIPSGVILKTGTSTLTSNMTTVTIRGADNQGSNILVECAPWLQFGLNNQMAVQVATLFSRGQAFQIGDQLILTDGTFVTPAIITVTGVSDGGSILSSVVTDGGNYSVLPPVGPLNYATSGNGVSASFTGTFSATALTAITFVAIGSGYTTGDLLTIVGGTAVGGTVVPCTLTVTNAVGGFIQPGGLVVTSGGSYGTPPVNPCAVTGGTGSGAFVNISNFTNRGGALVINNLHFIAAAPNVQILQAQFNLSFRSTEISDIKCDYLTSPAGCNWGVMFDIFGATNSIYQNIDVLNNIATLPNNTAGFIFREQNNMLGHYEFLFNHVSLGGGWIAGFDFKLTDAPGFQGLRFDHCGVGPGQCAYLLENTSAHTGYIEVYFNDCYDQMVQFASITTCAGLVITNCSISVGTNRMPTPPASLVKLYLYNCKQGMLQQNIFGTAISTTPNATFVQFDGPCGNWTCCDNHFSNAAKIPTCVGYNAGSQSSGISEYNDIWGGGVTPVINTATGPLFNTFSSVMPAGNLAVWGRAVSFAAPVQLGRPVDGGANPVSAGMGGAAWYSNPWHVATTSAPVAGRLYAAPIYIPSEITVKTTAFNIATASTGNWQARMGIYTNIGGSRVRSIPGTLVAGSDTGNLSYTSASTGAVQTTINGTSGVILQAGWYWLAWCYDGASNPQLTCLGGGAGPLAYEFSGFNSAAGVFANFSPSDSCTFSYTGVESLPTTFGATLGNALAPFIAITAGA